MNKLRERAKQLNIPRRHKMTREELEKAIEDTTLKYKELIFTSDVVCKDCLNELRKHELLDEKQYKEKLMEQTIRDLSYVHTCLCTNTVIDGDIIACSDCGLVLEDSETNGEGDFLSHKVKRRNER